MQLEAFLCLHFSLHLVNVKWSRAREKGRRGARGETHSKTQPPLRVAAFFLNTSCALLIAAIAVFCAQLARSSAIAKQRCCLHSLVFCYHLGVAAANLHLNGADGNGGKPFSLPISLSQACSILNENYRESGVSQNLFVSNLDSESKSEVSNCFLLTRDGIVDLSSTSERDWLCDV